MQSRDFKITIPITRAYKDEDGYTYLEGIASTTQVDSHDTIFNKNCQEGFAIDVNESAETDEPVKLEAEHKGDELPVLEIGSINRANVTEEDELFVRAILDVENPIGLYYYNSLTNPDPKLGRPKEFGLSINGAVEAAHWEYRSELGKTVRVFDRVRLKKIGIVRKPSNSGTWVEKVARSVDWETVNTKENLMSENQSLEVETQVERTEEETVTETVETTTAAEVQEEAQVPADAVVETPVETAEVVAETLAEVPATEEIVERTDTWNVEKVLTAVAGLTAAMSQLESYGYCNWDEGKVARAKSVLNILNGALPLLSEMVVADASSVLTVEATEERALDTTNMAGHVHEDLSDDVTETIEESAERSVVEFQEGAVEVTDANAPVLAAIKEVVDEIKRSFDAQISEAKTTIEGLTNQLKASEQVNVELVERVAKLEKSPASTPGQQITRSSETIQAVDKAAELKERIARAKAEKNATEYIRLTILGDWNNL